MNNISTILSNQQFFFKTQKTKEVSFRLKKLKALKAEIISNEHNIYKALKKDFNKSKFESFLSEFGLVISELDLTIKKIKKWSKPQRIRSSVLTFPSKDYIYIEPYGNVLIIAPWNYPFLLSMEPVIMAIAAGNTVVLKPSELTPNISKLISNIIENVFAKEHVITIEGGIETSTKLLEQRWDYIFFTGSVKVGKTIALAAAKHLTPVTLELGGKSPCIIDDTTDLNLVAKRLVWGKLLNAGQTCISPDYVIVKSNIKEKFVNALKERITKLYGHQPETSHDFPRIINSKNTERLNNYLKESKIIFGGKNNISKNYIAPTLVDNPSLDSKIMQEEIFGPILPILTYETEKDIERLIWSFEKPLAFYIFSNDKIFSEKLIKKYSFGGGVLNDTLIHFGNPKLPFGGVGNSGLGAYHGKFGFDTFSHKKSIIKRSNWTDPPVRYAPYTSKKFNILKQMFKWFG